MGASGDVTSSDGSGARASTFLDAMVAFVVGIFQPVFSFLATHILPSESRQHNNQNRDRSSDDTTGDQQQHTDHDHDHDHDNQHDHQAQQENGDGDQNGGQDGGQDGDSESMQGQLQGQRAANNRPPHAYGPKASANGRSSNQIALPQTVSEANGQVNQNASVNGDATKTALGDVTNSLNNNSKINLRSGNIGENETKENRQEDTASPLPVQPLEDPEDPAQAAEREIHFGFMNEALDMVRCLVFFLQTIALCVLLLSSFVLR